MKVSVRPSTLAALQTLSSTNRGERYRRARIKSPGRERATQEVDRLGASV